MSTGTREKLIENATDLVRMQGFAGFSYADLANAVGIRKASIHHHFPAKEDLGVAIVEAYTEGFVEALDDLSRRYATARERLKGYAGLYRVPLLAGKPCLCGVMASEFAILPMPIKLAVQRFFELNQRWLDGVLSEPVLGFGVERRHRAALAFLSGLQGAALLTLTRESVDGFDQTVNGLLEVLIPKAP